MVVFRWFLFYWIGVMIGIIWVDLCKGLKRLIIFAIFTHWVKVFFYLKPLYQLSFLCFFIFGLGKQNFIWYRSSLVSCW